MFVLSIVTFILYGLGLVCYASGNSPKLTFPLFLSLSPSLQYAQTSSGKCRAWIRLAVNECSLESYITVLTQDAKLLSQYYESYSFLRDSEMVAALTQLLAGLSQINFNMLVESSLYSMHDDVYRHSVQGLLS